MTSNIASDSISADLEPIDVSIIMAAYNSEQYIEEAIDSCLKQTGVTFELIIIDDGSDRALAPLVEDLTSHDPRVTILATIQNYGPGHARNLGLKVARGEFVAIVDSDDYLAPTRLANLIAQGRVKNADIVVDDLVEVSETKRGRALRPFLRQSISKRQHVICLTEFMSSGVRSQGKRCYGYLKPVIRRSTLIAGQYAYRSALRISEDYYLVSDMLRDGAKMLFVPHAGYYYRKHMGSLTHRADIDAIKAIVVAEKVLREESEPALTPQQKQLSKKRSRFYGRMHRFEKMVHSVKSRDYASALRTFTKYPPDMPSQATKVVWLLLKKAFTI
ncbi:MAG: glycosyltransferase family 2 protein [Henriciella sp.]